jgi:hypothetical protein
MVRHHNRNVEFVLLAVIMAARRQGNVASPIRRNPPQSCDKRDEMRLEIPLQMRQIAPVTTAHLDSGMGDKEGLTRSIRYFASLPGMGIA